MSVVSHRSHSDSSSALAAALVIAVGMGFGRFAFTGVYPAMVSEGVLSVGDGTLAASANYLGYLLGALLAAKLGAHHARAWAISAVGATVLCLASLAWVASPAWIVVIRGISGVFSALSMIAASVWLFQHRAHPQGAPLLFAGVGFGIAVSAELLALGQSLRLDSHALWGALAVVASIIGGIGLLRLESDPAEARPGEHAAGGGESPNAATLILIYGLAGLGYIITATYLPLLIGAAMQSINPVHLWAVFGLGAVPSCYLWHRLNVRLGSQKALALNLVLQGSGVVLPALSGSLLAYLASALIVGATFMGTVTIAMPAAKRLSVSPRINMMAAMTAAYGIGQIAGPLLAGGLYARTHSFSPSLWIAAAALWLAALLSHTRRAG
ncbi:YbfB/YjiJ family MFS transporter [Pseudomonas sp. LRF_L74]|uniref:YbfB/YjiJ family MFS transporter n=1 Tax=Pseudomonas sp. LRF_L74 TaxID=3369422 RepID=UPI003F62C1CB